MKADTSEIEVAEVVDTSETEVEDVEVCGTEVIQEDVGSDNSTYESIDNVEEILSTYIEDTKEPECDSKENYISNIRLMIGDEVGEGEVIENIELKGKELRIYVDILNTEVDVSNISLKELAELRVSSITDDILELDDSSWETVRVIFKEVGESENTKDDIVYSEYGKYFDNVELNTYDNYTEEYKYTKEDLVDATYILVSESYGKDNCNVSIEDNVLVVSIWKDGVSTAALLINSGNTKYLSGWNNMVQGTVTAANTWYNEIKELNVDGVDNVEVRVLNDVNKDNVLVSILNGNVVYDIINVR